MTAEFATLKILLPRSKKPLVFHSDGQYDSSEWQKISNKFGPAGRVGDQIQITKVTIESDKILFEINNGMKGRGHWYDRIEIGMGNRTSPINTNQNAASATGSNIALVFPDSVPAIKSSEIKKLLAPLLDFEKRSATEQYVEKLPAPIQKAIKEQKAIEGMDHEQVLLAMGKPRNKSRETRDGDESEDWIYGDPPGKITFVTFTEGKVVHVRESYANIGGSTAPPLAPH